MFLEPLLRKNSRLIKVFTGIRAEDFWLMIDQMETEFFEYELNRHKRDNRKRAIGAGRNFEQSLAKRTVGVFAYLRLHTSQTVIATMFGLQQYEISPLINADSIYSKSTINSP
jgi:hypothetical protein